MKSQATFFACGASQNGGGGGGERLKLEGVLGGINVIVWLAALSHRHENDFSGEVMLYVYLSLASAADEVKQYLNNFKKQNWTGIVWIVICRNSSRYIWFYKAKSFPAFFFITLFLLTKEKWFALGEMSEFSHSSTVYTSENVKGKVIGHWLVIKVKVHSSFSLLTVEERTKRAIRIKRQVN